MYNSGRMKILFSGLCLFLTLQSALFAETFSSGPEKTHLIELFTSEGCSSCPPAEEWLSGLKDEKNLWKDYVPVAFHVDYWDHLGWKDVFGSADHSKRQHRYAAAWKAPVIYTPGFVLNGREWKDGTADLSALPKDNARPGVLTVESKGGSHFKVSFRPLSTQKKNLKVHGVLLAMDVAADIAAGENGGKRLQHDFAVLYHAEKELTPSVDERLSAVIALEKPKRTDVRRYAAAFWVASEKDDVPVQAVGGFLKDAR